MVTVVYRHGGELTCGTVLLQCCLDMGQELTRGTVWLQCCLDMGKN